jgi:putative endonuclease
MSCVVTRRVYFPTKQSPFPRGDRFAARDRRLATTQSGKLMGKEYFIYIMTNKYNTVLYTGVTNNLMRRVWEHKEGFGSTFTNRYRVEKLVYYDSYENINLAIEREKQIKGGSRQKKINLINGFNPNWNDLYEKMIQ